MYILTYKIYDTDGKHFCNWSFTTTGKYNHARKMFPKLRMEKV